MISTVTKCIIFTQINKVFNSLSFSIMFVKVQTDKH